MDGTWELDGISAETSQDVRHRREHHAPRTGDEELGGLELSVGDAAGSNSGRPAVAHAAQRHQTADRRDEDPVIEVLEAVEPRAPAHGEGLEELSRPRVVDPKGARNAQGEPMSRQRGRAHVLDRELPKQRASTGQQPNAMIRLRRDPAGIGAQYG